MTGGAPRTVLALTYAVLSALRGLAQFLALRAPTREWFKDSQTELWVFRLFTVRKTLTPPGGRDATAQGQRAATLTGRLYSPFPCELTRFFSLRG